MSMFRGSMFNYGIDRASHKKCEPGYIKPKQENDNGSQRTVGLAVGIKEVQVQPEYSRGRKPQCNPDHRSRSNPVPVPFEIGKSTRLNSSHLVISYAVFCLKKKKHT